ncbi:MAG: caspase family protein [Bacteroidales bacterium]|nr:caspase family protein [Bacteroidales bacterium]
MKRITILIILIIGFALNGYNQDVINGKSPVVRFNIEPIYKRTFPPNLYTNLSFRDDNGNGILEAEEKANLILTINNRGKGKAQGLDIKVTDNNPDSSFQIGTCGGIYFINPDEQVKITIPIKAGFNVKTAEHKLKIDVKEHFGYDMDPAYLVLNTLEFQKPKLVFSGFDITDTGQETAAIIQDGQLQAGEQVKVKVVVQNIGQNIAYNTKYKVWTTDDNIYLDKSNGTLGDINIGEVKEFFIILSPNKRINYKGNLPIFLSVNDEPEYGSLSKFQIPIALNQTPPKANTVKIVPNIEKISKQIARFEYSSNKFTANVGNVKDISEVQQSNTVRPNSVAVIFGVENYSNLPPAPYAKNDANIIEKYFKERLGIEKVVSYKNSDVSGFIFDDIFNPDYGELQKAIIKGQTDLFVFYSGHGVPDKDGKKIYLFPSDGKIERIESQGYDLNKFYQNLEKLGAKSVTVFIDACFSGQSRRSEKINTSNLIAAKGVKVRPILDSPWVSDSTFNSFNSSSFDQTSLGFDQSQTGLFTYYLCLGLKGEADANGDKKITNGELYDYIKTNVTEKSKKIYGTQTPQFNGNREMIIEEL